jgi:hypothetical protein
MSSWLKNLHANSRRLVATTENYSFTIVTMHIIHYRPFFGEAFTILDLILVTLKIENGISSILVDGSTKLLTTHHLCNPLDPSNF